ncbi:hypothetical protein BH23BAC1_BH23BAC1_32250 [soil metagenome]
MVKCIFISGLIFLLFLSCKKELSYVVCINAKVIGPQMCTLTGPHSFYLVEILNSEKIGDEIIYYDGIKYNNVVEVHNLPEINKVEGNIIYFNYKLPDTKIIYACERMNYTFDVPQISFIGNCNFKE